MGLFKNIFKHQIIKYVLSNLYISSELFPCFLNLKFRSSLSKEVIRFALKTKIFYETVWSKTYFHWETRLPADSRRRRVHSSHLWVGGLRLFVLEVRRLYHDYVFAIRLYLLPEQEIATRSEFSTRRSSYIFASLRHRWYRYTCCEKHKMVVRGYTT